MLMYLAYPHEFILHNTTELPMYIFVINKFYSCDIHWMGSARVSTSCNLPAVPLA